MNEIKTFKVTIEVAEDFCESDLHECIKDGIENIGNHETHFLAVQKVKE